MSTWLGILLALVLLALNALFVAAEFALISARRTAARAGGAGRLAHGAPGPARDREPDPGHRRGPARHHDLLARPRRRRRAGDRAPAGAALRRGRDCRSGLVHPIVVRHRADDRRRSRTSCSARWCPRTSRSPAPTARRCSSARSCWPWSRSSGRSSSCSTVAADARSVRLLRIEPKGEVASTFTHDEVAGLVEESRREGLLDEDEYDLVSGALEFHEGTVDQVLLPRAAW